MCDRASYEYGEVYRTYARRESCQDGTEVCTVLENAATLSWSQALLPSSDIQKRISRKDFLLRGRDVPGLRFVYKMLSFTLQLL
jgi:hypothetical protein